MDVKERGSVRDDCLTGRRTKRLGEERGVKGLSLFRHVPHYSGVVETGTE